MPKVGEVEGFIVHVYTRDEHPPAHVHVEKAGAKMKIMIRVDEVEYHSYKGRERGLRREPGLPRSSPNS
jgi:hypothetical protein